MDNEEVEHWDSQVKEQRFTLKDADSSVTKQCLDLVVYSTSLTDHSSQFETLASWTTKRY